MEKNPWLRALIVLAVLFVGAQLFAIVWDFARQFADIIVIFLLAWLTAFLLNPAVQSLSIERHVPRILAVGIVYAGMLAILVVIGVLIVPPTATQFTTLATRFPQYADSTTFLLERAQSWLAARGLSADIHQLGSTNDLTTRAQALGTSLASNALSLAQGVLVAIFDGFVVLILSFYMTLDGPRINRALLQITPGRFKADADLLIASIDRSFGGFLRASLVLMVVYGAGTSVAMFALGVPFALPVSVFAGAMMIIPLVGAIVAVVPPVAIALVSVGPARAAILLVIMILLQQVVLQVLQPRIMGKSVGLHPLWVLASVLVGARAAGVWGAVFSVPLAAIIQTIVQLYYFRAAGNLDREGALARSLLGTTERERSEIGPRPSPHQPQNPPLGPEVPAP